MFFSVNVFFQKENVEGEFDVTEKVKRKKKVTIFNQEDFLKTLSSKENHTFV